MREHSPEDELAVLKVADELGEGYVDWYPFEHPQLGPGRARRLGHRPLLVQPTALAARGRGEAARGLRALPRARLAAPRDPLVRVGAGRRRRVPTAARARERGLAPDERHARRRSSGVRCGRSRSSSSFRTARASRRGKEREEAGQLGGRVERRQVTWWGTDHSTAERTKVEWVIEAKPATASASSPATSAPAPSAPSSSSRATSACGRPRARARRAPGAARPSARILVEVEAHRVQRRRRGDDHRRPPASRAIRSSSSESRPPMPRPRWLSLT